MAGRFAGRIERRVGVTQGLYGGLVTDDVAWLVIGLAVLAAAA